jgi:hypothetical protein
MQLVSKTSETRIVKNILARPPGLVLRDRDEQKYWECANVIEKPKVSLLAPQEQIHAVWMRGEAGASIKLSRLDPA